MAGQPKKIKSGEELVRLYREFCTEIVNGGFENAPTFFAFEAWLCEHYKEIDIRTVYNTIHEYFPNKKSEIESIRADVVSQGTMLGKYQPSMSIFALKNWCGWTDKQEIKAEQTVNVSAAIAELEKMVADDKG